MSDFSTVFYGCGINYSHCKEDCYWYREESDMGAHIPYCQSKGGNFIEPKDCENCEHYHSKYKKTNADRIRSMTDEELMTWIMEMQACPYELYQDCQHPNYDCEMCIKDWLKQESKEET